MGGHRYRRRLTVRYSKSDMNYFLFSSKLSVVPFLYHFLSDTNNLRP